MEFCNTKKAFEGTVKNMVPLIYYLLGHDFISAITKCTEVNYLSCEYGFKCYYTKEI